MNLHRDYVRAFDQQTPEGHSSEDGRTVIRSIEGQCGVRDCSVRHIEPGCFRSVNVNDRPIVALDIHVKVNVTGRIGDQKVPPEISGDVLIVRIQSESDHRGFVAVAISQLSRTACPSCVVEGQCCPVGALVGAVIQIFPN